MGKREEIIELTVSKLQNIHALEDFKENEPEIMILMDKYIESSVDMLRDFLENMFSMTPAEREAKAQMFQNESFPFEPLVEKEMQRLDGLPGFIDYSDEFGSRMDKMMEPHMEQYAKYMEKIMANIIGGVSQVMDGMSQAFEATEEEVEEEEKFEFDYDNPQTPAMLYDLYYSRTLETLKENKGSLIESCEEQLQEDIWDLEVFTDLPTEELFDRDKEKITKIRKHMERLEPEMEKEFERLETLPEAAEEAKAIHKEIMDRLTPKIIQIKGFLGQLN